jgi:hypothetical protein
MALLSFGLTLCDVQVGPPRTGRTTLRHNLAGLLSSGRTLARVKQPLDDDSVAGKLSSSLTGPASGDAPSGLQTIVNIDSGPDGAPFRYTLQVGTSDSLAHS